MCNITIFLHSSLLFNTLSPSVNKLLYAQRKKIFRDGWQAMHACMHACTDPFMSWMSDKLVDSSASLSK